MCGIAGIIHKKGGTSENIGAQMTSMLQALKHRGPDSTGYAVYGEDNGNQIMRLKVADQSNQKAATAFMLKLQIALHWLMLVWQNQALK